MILQELAQDPMNLDGTNFKTILLEDIALDYYKNEEKVYIVNNGIKYMLNGEETNIMRISEFAKKNSLMINDEPLLVINVSNVYDYVVYSIIDYGVHNSKGDICCRYAYNRTKIMLLK